MSRFLLLVLALVTVALGTVGVRARRLDAGVDVHQSAARLDAPGPIELVRAERPAGSEAVFEVCSPALSPAHPLEGVRFAVVDRGSGRTLLERAIDPSHIRVGTRYACSVLVSADPVGARHDLAIVARPAHPIDAAVVGRIVTRMPLSAIDAALVAWLAVLALVGLGYAVRTTAPDADADADEAPRSRGVRDAVVACLVLAATLYAASILPLRGANGGLARSGLILAVQIGIVAFATLRVSPASIGFVPPSRKLAVALLAPTLAFATRAVANRLVAILPKLGRSSVEELVAPSVASRHVETVLDSPSGLLVLAAVAVVAPVVEELFFRGVVYGYVERARGAKAAGVVAALAFVLAHAPQDAHNPAAMVSITLLSVIATILRARFGSVIAPAATHFLHNAVIVVAAFVASR